MSDDYAGFTGFTKNQIEQAIESRRKNCGCEDCRAEREIEQPRCVHGEPARNCGICEDIHALENKIERLKQDLEKEKSSQFEMLSNANEWRMRAQQAENDREVLASEVRALRCIVGWSGWRIETQEPSAFMLDLKKKVDEAREQTEFCGALLRVKGTQS
jgi:hypothetical protein